MDESYPHIYEDVMAAKLYDFQCKSCEHKDEHWTDIEKAEVFPCSKCGSETERCFPSPDFKMPWTGTRGVTSNGMKFETVGEPRRYNPQTGEFKEKIK
jgi:putative FmdB family regulatory protein